MKFYFNKKNKYRWRSVLFSVLFFLTFCFFAFEFLVPICCATEKDQGESIDFTSFSLEELKQVTIISVLKRPQKLSEATSAITVITHEDIRRSGATSLPELLRNVPGFQVAQIDSSTWAVSARGFNHRYANKLLVLMDGRSLYTPLFSGVYWNVQDTLFEDIERIEVIRGPGSTLWGANAVNGVINIITKNAEHTQGGLVTASMGDEEKRSGAFRYGGKLGENAYGRFYLKYFEKDEFWKKSNTWLKIRLNEDDGWDSLRFGGRFDWSFSGSDSLTVQGDTYDGEDSEKMGFFDFVNNFSGGNMIARWTHSISNTSDMSLQLYYDKTKQEINDGFRFLYKEQFDIIDMDFQHNFKLGNYQEIIWGFGYRSISDQFEFFKHEPVHYEPDPNMNDPNNPFPPHYSEGPPLDPESRVTNIISAFFQDEISIINDRFRLTLGSKFEHNDYTGFEVQPGIRMLWKASDIQNVWASVSRAVRTPSRYEYDTYSFMWSPRLKNSENLIAYELGYRIQLTRSFALDLASYFNEYDHLNIYTDIDAAAETYGLELSANWDVFEWWRIEASYTYLNMHITQHHYPSPPVDPNFSYQDTNYPKPPPPPPPDISPAEFSPNHQFVIHSSIDFYRDLKLDLELRYVDNLGIFVNSYTELDARLGWKPRKDVELSIVGRNLLHDHHLEFPSHGFLPFSGGVDTEVERSVYGKVTCLF
ncbi:MAG: TonB-dependent receptor plug domain-containing protein [bacterium]